MSQLSKSKRVTIANGFAILAAALLMWVFTTRRAQRQSDQPTSTVVKVAVDLSPDGLRVDSLGEITGRAKKLLELVLPQREYDPSLSIESSELPTMQLATKLSKGEINYLICDKNLADAIVAVDSTLQSSKGIGFELQQVWLVNATADSLKVAIDSAIIAKRGSQEWLEIINELEKK